MKKILFVIGDMERGGAQRVVSILANNLCEEYNVSIGVLLENGSAYELNPKINILELGNGSRSYIKRAPRLVANLRACIKKEGYDLIVSFVGRVNLVTIVANSFLGVPLIISERNDPEYDNRNKLEKMICRLLYAIPQKVIFQTHYQKEWYGKRCEHNGVIIGNPIAMQPYYGNHEKQGIVAVGKLMPQKNHKLLIDAFSMISSKITDDIFIFGEGNEELELKEYAKNKDVSNRINFCGNIQNVDEMMKEMPIYVMTSNYEGLSNSLIEAMMNGMICISTKWNGVEDLIRDGCNGFLVEKNNALQLAEKIQAVLDMDQELKSEISREAINTAYSYHLDNILNKWKNELRLWEEK